MKQFWPARGTTHRQGAPGGAAASRGAGNDGLDHLAYLYDDERDYLSALSTFVQVGLRNAEPAFVAVPGRRAALLRERLGAESPLLRYGAIAETGRNPARLIPELYAFVQEHPGQRVRYIGESIWPGRSDAELCEVARHEALINLAFATSAVSILCPYDVRGLGAWVVGGAQRTHPSILQAGLAQPASGYAEGVVPAECEDPLPAPPAGAQALGYETSLRPVRDLVASHGAALGMAADRITNLVIAAGEITANTLRHTSAGGTFWIWHTGEEIICQVQDQGWIADPLAGRQRHSPEDSGHGLWVVNQVCDLVEIRSSQAAGTIIRLHMRRESA
ncbi:MAG TPA: sensor histidine kinase [Streptosporangiaceae bacterium]|jgi:anti-sigma regulatory factor (Ser/Thr protein kinase)